jgi:hypothetical protein
MIAFPEMLEAAAREAGISVPEDVEHYDSKKAKEAHPHFFVFCELQLGRAMGSWTEHWDNAKIIARIPIEKLKTMKLQDFLALGLHIKT